MTTRALDVVTILHALQTLHDELQTTGWHAKNPQQQQIFIWLEEIRETLARITGLEAKASRFWKDLNTFLAQRGFDPLVEPFDPDYGLGVVSVLDKLVRWLNGPGEIVALQTEHGGRAGFELPSNGVNIYEVEGYNEAYLLQLLTQSDDTLWLFTYQDTSLESLDLVKLAMNVMNKPRKTPMRKYRHSEGEYPVFAGARVPMVDFNIKPDLGFLLEAETTTKNGDHYTIVQAAQQYKFRMNETGARVRVATDLVVFKTMPIREEPVVFEVKRPFYGWWTQGSIDLPMAAFFSDWDAFRKPEGALKAL